MLALFQNATAIVANEAIDLCVKLNNSLTSVVILRLANGDRALM